MAAGCDGGARRARSARSAGVPVAGPRACAPEARLEPVEKVLTGMLGVPHYMERSGGLAALTTALLKNPLLVSADRLDGTMR